MNEYTQRNQTLEKLGYGSYSDYLKSRKWRKIQNTIPSERCYGCGCRPDEVHHRSYSEKTLLGNAMEELVAVCHKCHHQAEFEYSHYYVPGEPDLFRTKMTLAQANERLEQIRQFNIKNKIYNFAKLPTDDEILEEFRKKARQYKSEGKSVRELIKQCAKDLGKYPYYRDGSRRDADPSTSCPRMTLV